MSLVLDKSFYNYFSQAEKPDSPALVFSVSYLEI